MEPSKRASLVQAFVQLGQDPDGRISLEQVRKILVKLNIEVDEDDLKDAVNEVCDEDCEKLTVDQVDDLTSSPKLTRTTSIISSGGHLLSSCRN